VDNDETLIVDHAQKDQPHFAIVLPVIDARENLILENQCRVQQVDAVLSDDFLSLLLVPLEFHRAPFKVS
jgi:hypothetical protein